MTHKESSNNYDPRKAEWNNTPIEDWEPSKWKQWKPKHTNTSYPAKVEREYLRIRYAVQQANDRLDASKARVKLKLTSHRSIGLQGTFPCKEGDIGKNGSPNKQYTISINALANDMGIKTAETKARELDWQLTTKTFQWTPELLGKQAQKITTEEIKPVKLISELIEEYEKDFWKTRTKNRQSIHNWKTMYLAYLKKLPQDVPLSKEILTQTLEKTAPNTEVRCRLIWQLKKFCESCNFNATEVLDSYATPQVKRKRRYPPKDEEIINAYYAIGTPLISTVNSNAFLPEQWQWIYGMIATYGLRPHEVFAIDLEAFIHPSNTLHLVTLNPEVTEGTKTGERDCGIPPLKAEWIEIFDLKNVKIPISKGNFRTRTKGINQKFRTTKIPFQPYDLRHAYALRGHRLRIPIKTMADFMGHTVLEHTETYQKWMDKETNIEIYKEIIVNKEIEAKEILQAEITSLKNENALLKTEIKALRQQLTERQLNEILNE